MASGKWLTCPSGSEKKCTYTFSQTFSKTTGTQGGESSFKFFGTGGKVLLNKVEKTTHGVAVSATIDVRKGCKRWLSWNDKTFSVGPDRYLDGSRKGQKWQPKKPKSQGKKRGAATGW